MRLESRAVVVKLRNCTAMRPLRVACFPRDRYGQLAWGIPNRSWSLPAGSDSWTGNGVKVLNQPVPPLFAKVSELESRISTHERRG